MKILSHVARVALVLASFALIASACPAPQAKNSRPQAGPVLQGGKPQLPSKGAGAPTQAPQAPGAAQPAPPANLDEAQRELEALRQRVQALEAKLDELEALERKNGAAPGSAAQAGGGRQSETVSLALALLEQLSQPGAGAARDPDLARLAEIVLAVLSRSQHGEAGGQTSGADQALKELCDRIVTGQSGGASNSSDAAFVVEPAADLKGRLGRLEVAFPDASKVDGTHVEVFAGDQRVAEHYGACQFELMPGAYVVVVSGARVENVRVDPRSRTRLRTGALHVNADSQTHVEIYPAQANAKDAQRMLDFFGERTVGLPAGDVVIAIGGQRQTLSIHDGQTTEF